MDVKHLIARLAKADFADAVGIAVGDDTVAAAHVRKRLHSVTVQALDSRPIEVQREARDAFVVDFVREFVEEHDLSEARLAVAIDQRDVLFGHMQLPATAADNLADVVRYEIDRVLPVPADNLLATHISRPLGTAGERLHVTVIGAIRERVERLQSELAEANLPPSAITAVAVALNDYYYYCRQADERTAGIYYRDGDQEHLVVSSRGEMISSLRFTGGGETRAERLWREIETTVPDAVEDEIERFADPGAEGLPSLATIVPDGFIAATAAGSPFGWHEAAAVGAALGQLGEAKSKVDLLPAELARAQEGVGLRELALAAVVVVLAIVLAGAVGVKNLSITNALAGEVDALLPRVTKISADEEANRKLLAKVKLLEEHRQTSVLAYLKAMTEGVPASAYLTTFRYKGGRLEVDGIAFNAAELISVLERSPYFKDVEFTAPTTKYLQSQERFSLRMGLER